MGYTFGPIIKGPMKRSSSTYEIRVEGLLDSLWVEWFGDMTITHVDGVETILTGELADQAALHGVIERVRDLGLNLISVRRVDGGQ